jgi:aminopeptidase N
MVKRLASNVMQLSAEDRIGLLSDYFALVKSGAMPPVDLITLLSGFKSEANDKVWGRLDVVLGGIDKVLRAAVDAPVHAAFVEFAAGIVGPAFLSVGWDAAENDSDNRKQLRATLMNAVSKFCAGNADILAEAKKRCDAFCQDPNDPSVLNADIRPAVLSIAVQGDPSGAVVDALMKAHDAATDGAVKCHIYSAIGDAPTASLKAKLLDWVLSDQVRAQDLFRTPASIATSGKEGAEAVFSWVEGSYDKIYGRLGETSMILFQHIVRISGAGFVEDAMADKVKAFWESKSVIKSVEKCLAQTVEGIRANSKFASRLKASDLAQASYWSSVKNA